jgi:hypothetical protein
MVSSGVPKEIPKEQTVQYQQSKAYSNSLGALMRIVDRLGVEDFQNRKLDMQAPTTDTKPPVVDETVNVNGFSIKPYKL